MRWLACLLLGACADLALEDVAGLEKQAVTPRQISIVYSENEDLTAAAWVADAEPTGAGLEIFVDGAWVPLGVLLVPALASDEAAYGVLLPGRHDELALRYTPERGKPEEFNLGPVRSTGALGLVATLSTDNGALDVVVTDPLSGDDPHVARSLEIQVRDAACELPVVVQEVSGELAGLVSVPVPDTTDGGFCVVLESGAARLTSMVITHPQLLHLQHTYVPPVVSSRAVVLPVVNLELPDPELCAATLAVIRETLDAATLAIDPNAAVSELATPPLGTDGACAHQDGAWLDWYLFEAAFLPNFGGPDSTGVVLYIDNLDMPIGNATIYQLQLYQEWAASYGAQLVVAALAPEDATASFPFVWSDTWTYAADPDLPGTLQRLVKSVLPLSRWAHPPLAQVPFFPDGAPEGVGFKVCDATFPITVTPNNGVYVPLDGTNPTYQVELPSTWSVAAVFTPVAVSAKLELCERYCGRPLEDWTASLGCWGPL